MSSEALERRESIRKLCVAWMSVPSLPDNAIPASPDDVLWLLAEVARLEQERDEAKHQRDNFERIARERAENAHVNWQARGAAEAALAVAREREQRWREALTEVRSYVRAAIGDVEGQRAVERHRMLSLTAGQVQCLADGLGLIEAALVDEPAAATLAEPGRRGANEPAVVLGEASLPGSASAAADDGRCPGCGWYVADCNCVASAAADESGETP